MANHTTTTTRPAFLESHFVDSEQQFDAAKLGMWIFLATEILFFGGLFAGYAISRLIHPELFSEASKEMDVLWGTVNTLVLIGSSFTVAMAIRSAQINHTRNIVINLGITIVLAFTFMVIKYFEWMHHFDMGIYAGSAYSFTGIDNPNAVLFFNLYYLMTGLHGIHVLIGIGIMTWLLVKSLKGRFNSDYYTPLEIGGLYWHLVDIIWIFLYPLFYLVH